MKSQCRPSFRLVLIAFAVVQAFPAFGQEIDAERREAIAELTDAKSEIRLGFGYLSDPTRRGGMYNGVREEQNYLSADVSVHRFDAVSGTRLRVVGRDLGLEHRELAVDYSRQGAWRFYAGYSQGVRYEPMVVTTRLAGIGTADVTVNGEPALRPVDLSMKRDLFSAGMSQYFDRNNAVHVRFTHETKDGARLFGRGTSGAMEFLAEPIDRTTETLEVSFSHTGKRLQLNGGYYGTLFANHANALYVSGGAAALANTTATVAAWSPMSMPLDNNSHQIFVSGGYNLTPLTRAALKVSHTVALQNENLIPANVLAGNGGTVPASPCPASHCPDGVPGSLNGRVDTLLAYLDVTSFEVDRLDVQANLRYEDRNDKTPVAKYMSGADDSGGIVAGAVPNAFYAGVTGYNKPRSWSSLKSKVEAGYRLPDQTRLLAGWELDQQERNAPERFSKVNFRTETDESTLYVEAKRPLLESLNASLGYRQARRNGSSYMLDTYVLTLPGGATSADPRYSVNPLLWADRDRTSWKATANWTPAESWSVYAVHEESSDHYEGMALGPRDGFRMFSSVDLSYALSERWNLHLWWSRDDTRAEQSTFTLGTNLGNIWQAKLRQLSEGIGGGVNGRTRSGIEMGVEFAFADQSAQHRMAAITGPAIASLPDYYYRQFELRAHGAYPLDKQSGVRAQYVFQDMKTDDWTWRDWTYSTDNATLTQDAVQRTHFIGLSYYYLWR